MNQIADRIILIRGAVSRRKFAESLDIRESTLRNYEQSASLPNSDLLKEICRLHNISPAWLLMGDGPMRPGESMPTATDSAPAPQAAPGAPIAAQEGTCTACTEMKKELEIERRERRELTAENRHLWKENGELREKCARLEERQFQRSIERGDTETVGNAG